jgi:hypothetical protein
MFSCFALFSFLIAPLLRRVKTTSLVDGEVFWPRVGNRATLRPFKVVVRVNLTNENIENFF